MGKVTPWYEYERHQLELEKEKKRAKKEDSSDEEMPEADIDWTDFILVDTIDMADDEKAQPQYAPDVTMDMLGIEEVGDKITEAELQM